MEKKKQKRPPAPKPGPKPDPAPEQAPKVGAPAGEVTRHNVWVTVGPKDAPITLFARTFTMRTVESADRYVKREISITGYLWPTGPPAPTALGLDPATCCKFKLFDLVTLKSHLGAGLVPRLTVLTRGVQEAAEGFSVVYTCRHGEWGATSTYFEGELVPVPEGKGAPA